MLVLKRKPKQKILIGDDIVITCLGKSPAEIGIEAPRHIPIVRAELGPREEKKTQ